MREKFSQLVAFLFGTTEPPVRVGSVAHVHIARTRRVGVIELERCA